MKSCPSSGLCEDYKAPTRHTLPPNKNLISWKDSPWRRERERWFKNSTCNTFILGAWKLSDVSSSYIITFTNRISLWTPLINNIKYIKYSAFSMATASPKRRQYSLSISTEKQGNHLGSHGLLQTHYSFITDHRHCVFPIETDCSCPEMEAQFMVRPWYIAKRREIRSSQQHLVLATDGEGIVSFVHFNECHTL